MTRTLLSIAAIVSLGASAVAPMAVVSSQAQGSAPADLSGAYQCKANPDPCLWPGPSPSISQSGNKLQIKNDKGESADATLTSDTTISAGGPFNSYGVVRPDQTIDWSNGTQWRKQ
jgi:hypothetical protein